jgi:hypothetical protein
MDTEGNVSKTCFRETRDMYICQKWTWFKCQQLINPDQGSTGKPWIALKGSI